MPRTKHHTLEERLRSGEAEAWAEYLETTRSRSTQYDYEELEMWAWSRLQERLTVIAARRNRIAA